LECGIAFHGEKDREKDVAFRRVVKLNNFLFCKR